MKFMRFCVGGATCEYSRTRFSLPLDFETRQVAGAC